MAEHYAAAGVSLEAGYKSVELIKEHVKKTMRPEVLGGLGGFSGAFSLSKIKDMEEPVLLSGTDGCGTKVKLAMVMNKHDTIGIDAVAMCVNDIACAGGEPLFFLDYIACGKNVPEKIADIVKGVSEGCLQSEAALIGGETAEHPGLMPEEDYDLAGFAVGVCDKKDMITGKDLNVGDVLIGLPSTGVHSNGFSLVRNVFDITEESLNTYYDELGKTLGEALLAPTKIYVKALKHIKASGITLKACSHITGGGFYENVPRMLKEGMGVEIDTKAFPKPPIFDLIQKNGDISTKEMYNVFNMGLGFVMAVDPSDVEKVQAALNEINEPCYVVGKVTETGQVASGSGTNFETILSHIEDGSLHVNCACLIADKENAYARVRAHNHGVEEFYFNPKGYDGKAGYEAAILEVLKEKKVDLIVLSGYMRFIGHTLLSAYPNRIINLHPAYLPEFPGAHSIADAYEAKVAQTGVTVHFVDEGVDTGPIIRQERVAIDPSWDLETLESHVHAMEYDLFWQVIEQVAKSIEEEK